MALRQPWAASAVKLLWNLTSLGQRCFLFSHLKPISDPHAQPPGNNNSKKENRP